MLKDIIEKDIQTAMKDGAEEYKINVLRAIKAEILNTEKGIGGKKPTTITDVVEVTILNKMCKERKESAEQYRKGGREDLASKEEKEVSIIEIYLPKMPSDDEVRDYTVECINSLDHQVSPRDTGIILQSVKQKYPFVGGKIVSETIINYLKTH